MYSEINEKKRKRITDENRFQSTQQVHNGYATQAAGTRYGEEQQDRYGARGLDVLEKLDGQQIQELLNRTILAIGDEIEEFQKPIFAEIDKLDDKGIKTLALKEQLKQNKRSHGINYLRDMLKGKRSYGTTLTVVIVKGNQAYTANLGDSRIVKFSASTDSVTATALTQDNKPLNSQERIKKEGGYVRKGRLGGMLAISRAFGNDWVKGKSRQPVIAVHGINDQDIFLLATDCLWEVLPNESIIELLQEDGDLATLGERALVTAYSKGSNDNGTVVVVQGDGVYYVADGHGFSNKAVDHVQEHFFERLLEFAHELIDTQQTSNNQADDNSSEGTIAMSDDEGEQDNGGYTPGVVLQFGRINRTTSSFDVSQQTVTDDPREVASAPAELK